jgi:hypothetical protein
MEDASGARGFGLEVSDPSQLRSLQSWLERVPDVRVVRAAVDPVLGEQGAWDLLTVVAGSGGALAVAIQTLPEFIRSRRSIVTLTMKFDGGKEFTLHAENLDQLPEIIEKILDA